MKRLLAGVLVAAFVLLSILILHPQEVIPSGQWKLFRQEHPPLDYVEITTPFVVRDVSGTIYFTENKPLEGATFEIGLKNGSVLGAYSDRRGSFQFPRFHHPMGSLLHPRLHRVISDSSVRPGTYRFKVTKNGFHSTIGTVVVSPKAPKESSIEIQLHIGT